MNVTATIILKTLAKVGGHMEPRQDGTTLVRFEVPQVCLGRYAVIDVEKDSVLATAAKRSELEKAMPEKGAKEVTVLEDKIINISAKVRLRKGDKGRVERTIRRIGRNRIAYVNQHGDYVQEATVILDGESVRVSCLGIGARWYTIKR